MSDIVVGLQAAKPWPKNVDKPTSFNLHPSSDQRRRCAWGASTADYAHYHDTEWGRPTTTETAVFERLCLEGFQAGLSWLTVLRKRENFRRAFANFDPTMVADFTETDVERLLQNQGIIRHRGKIEATINNARATRSLWTQGQTLTDLVWSFQPPPSAGPKNFSEVPTQTTESTALSKALKKVGFRFVGPTTVYAAMEAIGVVNDHLIDCWARADITAH